jgi:fluoride exporter
MRTTSTCRITKRSKNTRSERDLSSAFDLRALLAIAFGGGIGSVLRYMVAILVTTRTGPGFPWSTLVINVTGSVLIGIIAEITQTRAVAASNIERLFWMVGVLGGYTTFSTFSLDVVTLGGDRAALLAVAYAVGSVILGVLGAAAGIVAVRAISL